MSVDNGESKRKVSSLRELPQGLEPPRDLWPQIEARIAAPSRAAARGRWLAAHWQPFAAAAAVAAALVVGMFIGRATLPGWPGSQVPVTESGTGTVPTAYRMTDPRFLREHAELMRSFNARLASLPPSSRAKVLASLDTIDRSMREIQTELGRDPGNALLQELLVNTYQDEIRVLTTVQEAGGPNAQT
jgi:hypothetical protein